MEKDRQPTGRLQATLDDMKRRLEEERESAELLTRRLSFHRDPNGASSTSVSRFGSVESELSQAHRHLNKQKANTEKWIEQVTSERDAGRARLREAEVRIQALQEELCASKSRMEEQRIAAEGLIQQMVAAQPGSAAAPTPELESRIQEMETELQTARQQLADGGSVPQEEMQQLAAERDRSRAELSEAAARAQMLENELSAARQQFQEQQAAAEQRRQAAEEQIQAIAAERDRISAQIAEAQAKSSTLETELSAARSEFDAQMQAAETRIQAELHAQLQAQIQEEVQGRIRAELQDEMQEIAAERDTIRAQYSEVESRTQLLEKEFMSAHDMFRQQREAAMQVIQQLETERDNSRSRLGDLEEVALKLEEELTKARSDLRTESSKVDITEEVRNGILDAVVDIQIKGQKLLDLLQAWSAKDADLNLEEVTETVNFFERTR